MLCGWCYGKPGTHDDWCLLEQPKRYASIARYQREEVKPRMKYFYVKLGYRFYVYMVGSDDQGIEIASFTDEALAIDYVKGKNA